MTAISEHRDGGLGVAATGGRVRRRFRPRWTAGHVVPVVMALLAAIFVLVGLRDRSATVLVPVASQPIPSGAQVTNADTHLTRVHRSESALLAGLMPASDLGMGWVTTARVAAGEPITLGMVSHGPAGGSGLGAMSLPVPLDRADGGAIQAGDRVDVISVLSGAASYVAQGLNVLAVSPSQTTGLLAGPSGDYWLTVAVDRATALRLAAALGAAGSSGGGADLEVVRSTSEPTPTSQSSSAQSSSSGGVGS